MVFGQRHVAWAEDENIANIIDTSALFAPLRIKGIELRNRFVVPSMQRGVSADGKPTDELAAYYRSRAEGGFALIMSESCAVDHPSAGGGTKVLKMAPDTRDAWRRCVEGVREAGGHMFLQLWHRGAVHEEFRDDPLALARTISPSGLLTATKPGGRPIKLTELGELKDAFVAAAVAAQEIGASGIELHGAHGYLLDQFLWPSTNRREDGYGGDDIAQRVRFPAEVVAAIRKAVGEHFVISFRFSQWKVTDYLTGQIVFSPEELGVMLGVLRRAGVDVFHVSTRRFHTPEWLGSDLSLAGWARKLTDAPVLAVGSVGGNTDLQSIYRTEPSGTEESAGPIADIVSTSLAEVMRRFNRGEFDLVAVGRASIGDPEWVNKVAAGRYDVIRKFELDHLLSLISAYNDNVKAPLAGA